MANNRLRTFVYVDGFNLYYGALRKTPYKWLDLEKFCRTLLPNDNVGAIKYFTAKVAGNRRDPDSPIRQQLYLRALATLPSVRVVFGHFLTHSVMCLKPIQFRFDGSESRRLRKKAQT